MTQTFYVFETTADAKDFVFFFREYIKLTPSEYPKKFSVRVDEFFGLTDRNSRPYTMTTENRRNPPKEIFIKFLKEYETALAKRKSNKPLNVKYEFWKAKALRRYQKLESLPKPIPPKRIYPKVKHADTTNNGGTSKIQTTAKYHLFLDNIINTYWYSYEWEKFKISRRIFHFKGINEEGYCDFTIKQAGDTVLWKGDVRFIDHGWLLVGICRKENSGNEELNYTHFTFQINNLTKELELAVGHKTYYNQNTKNINTKTVILERQLKNEKKLSAANFEFGDSVVEPKISAYLENKNQNRLSSPHKFFYNLRTFQDWFDSNDPKSKISDEIIGTYQMIYYTDSEIKNRVIDYIEIIKIANGHLKILYRERRRDSKNFWSGIVYEDSDSNSLNVQLLSPENENDKRHSDQVYYMILHVPKGKGKKIDTLTGLIAGIREELAGPVARMIVITKLIEKKEIKNRKKISKWQNVHGFNIQDIHEFFFANKNNSRVRPPHDKIIWSFSQLNSKRSK